MQIIFNIAENSNVELIKGNYELVQGECCVTEFKFNFPATIRGVAIDNYKKRIEFSECKTFGECAKFIDDINGDTYELDEMCTAFKKIIIQVVLTYNNIKWKTLPVALEFHESVNAEGNTVIQAQLLSLSKIERDWENYIKAHTFRVIKSTAEIPTADASSLGDTIFYLGANTDTAPLLTYGHYYKCNYVNEVYEWTDLTQDASLSGVADGVREINNNQTLQFWVGDTEELENEVPQENVAYIAQDESVEGLLSKYVPDIPVKYADTANKLGASFAFGMVSGSEVFENVPLEDNTIYAFVFTLEHTYLGETERESTRVYYGSGFFVCDLMSLSKSENEIPLSSPYSPKGTEFLKIYMEEGQINIDMDSIGARATEFTPFPNKLLFYKIGTVDLTKVITISRELETDGDYSYIEVEIPKGYDYTFEVGEVLEYAGDIAIVTGFSSGSGGAIYSYTIKAVTSGAIASAIGKTIVVRVKQ